MNLKTPYYFIDEKKLLKNLKVIKRIREASGAKFVLALKCFSTWGVFGLMRKYMDGTTSSSLYETRLGREKFGKETHSYCVGYSKDDIKDIGKYADKVIFNSVSQLKAHRGALKGRKLGLRVNPGISYSHFDLADPARRFSRLGVSDINELLKAAPLISGVMFHFNCENDNFANFSKNMDFIGNKYGKLLKGLEWISIGGGLYFTKNGYPVDKFANKLKDFSLKHGVQIYLEPGESAITNTTELVTSVVDVVSNEMDIAIVDASTEAHMLDLLIYRQNGKIANSDKGKYKYMVAGRSCLAGDVFGVYRFNSKLKSGSVLRFADAAGYTMVKKNWFNGLQMPSIVIKRLDGKIDVVRSFNYNDFKNNLS